MRVNGIAAFVTASVTTTDAQSTPVQSVISYTTGRFTSVDGLVKQLLTSGARRSGTHSDGTGQPSGNAVYATSRTATSSPGGRLGRSTPNWITTCTAPVGAMPEKRKDANPPVRNSRFSRRWPIRAPSGSYQLMALSHHGSDVTGLIQSRSARILNSTA